MPLKITDPQKQVSVLNKWADDVDRRISEASSHAHIGIASAAVANTAIAVSSRANLHWTGTWTSSTQYSQNDVVQYVGQLFIANSLNIGIPPTSDSVIWTATLLAGTITTAELADGAATEVKIGLTDVTTNDVSTGRHGFTPKLSGDATTFLNGSGTYTHATPGAANQVAVFNGANQLAGDSLLTENGTTLAYTGTGGVSAPKLTSTVATGTAPLVVASTTNVPNLNASSLSGATFASPGPIGGGTPSTAAFTTVTGTSTTQSPLDNSTNLATTAYADNISKSVGQVGWREDFITSPTNAITTGTLWAADTVWVAIQIAGGTQTVNNLDGTFTNPGQTQFTTAAVSGEGIALYKGNAGGGRGTVGALGSNAGWERNFVFKLTQTTNCCVRWGFFSKGEAIVDPPTDGMYVEYDTANTGNTDSKFTWVTRSAGTPNYNITNAIAADTSFHHFRIRSLVAGTILFSVDGGTETPITTDISTLLMTPAFQFIARSAAAVIITADFDSYIAITGRT